MLIRIQSILLTIKFNNIKMLNNTNSSMHSQYSAIQLWLISSFSSEMYISEPAEIPSVQSAFESSYQFSLVDLDPTDQEIQIQEASLISESSVENSLADENCHRNIGLILSVWNACNGSQFIYASGFAISQYLVLTCAHAVHSQRLKRRCDKIYFIPNHEMGRVRQNRIFRSRRQNFILYDLNGESSKEDIENDIAIFILQKSLTVKRCLKLPRMDEAMLTTSMTIIGYPNQQYCKNNILEQIQPKRVTTDATLLKSNCKIIYYKAKTSLGFSGSPILYSESTGLNIGEVDQVSAIHVRHGVGVLLTEKVQTKLQQFAECLLQQHHCDYQISDLFEMFPAAIYSSDIENAQQNKKIRFGKTVGHKITDEKNF